MADNLLVGKWSVVVNGEDIPEGSEPAVIQFYKDGSCSVPVYLLGSESEDFPEFLFYQAFENKTIRFESGEPGMFIYRYAYEGTRLVLKTLDGRSFAFEKREGKKVRPRVIEGGSGWSDNTPEVAREPEAHEWKCPKCGKINQNYVGTCGCGEAKPKDKPAFNWAEVHPELAKKPEPEEAPIAVAEPVEEAPKGAPIPDREPEAHEWRCPSCGKINQNYVGTCGCGEAKPKEAPAFNWAEVHPELAKKPEPVEAPIAIEEPVEEAPKGAPIPQREPEAHEWRCPSCGKINQNYVGTCGCGEAKPKEAPAFNWAEVHPELAKKPEPETPAPIVVEEPKKQAPAAPEREAGENEWKCPKCGKINQNYVGTCGCGEGKPKPVPAE